MKKNQKHDCDAWKTKENSSFGLKNCLLHRNSMGEK